LLRDVRLQPIGPFKSETAVLGTHLPTRFVPHLRQRLVSPVDVSRVREERAR
jgi:hypothetical protein